MMSTTQTKASIVTKTKAPTITKTKAPKATKAPKLSKKTSAPTNALSPSYRRVLVDTEDNDMHHAVPAHRALQIIESRVPTLMPNSASSKVCFRPRAVNVSFSLARHRWPKISIKSFDVGEYHTVPEGDQSWYTFAHKNSYNKKLSVADLVSLVGNEEAHKLLDIFYKIATKARTYLARHGSPEDYNDEVYYSPWHIDKYSTVEVVLNAGMEGSEIMHLTRDGAQRHTSLPGTAITHGTDSVHGATPQTKGTRYMLIIKHHFDNPNKPVVLSRDLIENIVPTTPAVL